MGSDRRPLESVYTLLEWDSAFFGFNVARLLFHHVGEALLTRVLEKCDEDAVRVLFFLADSCDAQSIHLAESNGFRFVDDRITLTLGLGSIDVDELASDHLFEIRQVAEEDIDAVAEIARDSFKYDRFHFDPGFSKSKADEMRAEWARNLCKGLGDIVFVAKVGQQVGGFIGCEVKSDGRGHIILTGVAPFAQGQGLGRILTLHALKWFQDANVEWVDVVTQSRNIAAQRLYQGCGFKTSHSAIWLHRWFDLKEQG